MSYCNYNSYITRRTNKINCCCPPPSKDGFPGPTGASGGTGPTGAVGPDGLTITGPAGPAGTGFTGPTGPDNLSETGPKGPDGESFTGDTGPDGESFTGPTGPDGLRGPTGYTSTQTGPTGPDGESFTGPQGPTGNNNTLQGPQGPTGESGTGPQGPPGPKDLTGNLFFGANFHQLGTLTAGVSGEGFLGAWPNIGSGTDIKYYIIPGGDLVDNSFIKCLGDDYFTNAAAISRQRCPPPSLAIQFQTVAITHAVVQITASQFGNSTAGPGPPPASQPGPYYTNAQNPWPISVGIEVFCKVNTGSALPGGTGGSGTGQPDPLIASTEFTVGGTPGTNYPKQSVCVCKELDDTLKAGCDLPAFVAVYIKTGLSAGIQTGDLNGTIFTPFNVAVTLYYETNGDFGQ